MVVVPKGWYHATCALDGWVVAVGMQKGDPGTFKQGFGVVEQLYVRDDNGGGGNSNSSREIGENAVWKELVRKEEETHPMPWTDKTIFHRKMVECGVQFPSDHVDSWSWFDGDVGKFYDVLVESDSKRNPKMIRTYAIHRWLGKGKSTLLHYGLILGAIEGYLGYYDGVREMGLELAGKNTGVSKNDSTNNKNDDAIGLRVLDAGCGLGAGLMWFETNPASKSWEMIGHTISEAQIDFIHKLPDHKFRADLKSYDDLDEYIGKDPFDIVYSIEAFIHSPDGGKTLRTWSRALADEGLIILIDDFISVGVDKDADDVQLFRKSWMANSPYTTTELLSIAAIHGLELVLDRDLGSEYEIIKNNYRNQLPELKATEAKNHQGWLGSKMRQMLMVQGKLTYRMIVLRKKTGNGNGTKSRAQLATERRPNSAGGNTHTKVGIGKSTNTKECTAVQTTTDDSMLLDVKPIKSQHMTGRGKGGGGKQACISGWYCCGRGKQWWENLEANRTDHTAYLKLEKSLFENEYMDSIVRHLNSFYSTLSKNAKGAFLDIGGAGSVASGMKQVTSKFAHFAGPFDYMVLDSDPKAKEIQNVVYCDMSNCSVADNCAYDVTFSHTVLEHTPRPWDAFDTIARVTKKGGLSIHVVPFSYQYHATPDDNYRFSHKALTSLMEDRGFEVLEVGYDICEKPEKILKTRIDEHFDTIWLSYVIAKKK